ncbi:MAG TPA: protease complex subunit PrcB family protein [Gammaproteobacteria bacterium]|nr:protease complex subunit PrcB family protein [Gammaproteobacteria bacterium]
MNHRTLFATLLLLGGCSVSGAGLEEAAPEAGVVRYSLQCSSLPREPDARWIRNEQQLVRASRQMQGALLETPPQRVPDVDLRRWNLLLVSAGEKPTAGYRLTLGHPAFTANNQSARLNVVLEQPAPDAVVAAVLTHPCMLVKVPAGSYHTVEIRGLERELKLRLR